MVFSFLLTLDFVVLRVNGGTDMINLMNIDCLPFMEGCKDNEFDLAIVDPPYGIGIDGQKLSICKNPQHNRKKHTFKHWDKRPSKEYFSQLFRISKNQIIWGGNYFVNYLSPSKAWIVWYKGQEGLTMSDAELAYCSFDKVTRVVKINRVELLKDNTIHPTQKPIKLYKWLLMNYAEKGQTIFDSHCGSGSIMIAAHDLGFDLTACEIDKDYFDAANKRFKNHIAQLMMF